ncbi:MAG: trigger factor [Flavobacteriales bacterium]|jgi:trigger factor|nr:trigger factor [Flavobacteriales bacterium]
MNVTKQDIDALNVVVKIDIAAKDYQDKVEKILKDYRLKANIPGFRKGNVPMGMVKQQYGKSALIDEVNKLIQENLNKFLTEEKLDILGNPLPKEQSDFSWDTDDFSFEFELGLAPKFDIDLQPKKAITQYVIKADAKMVGTELQNMQERYGKLKTQTAVEKNSNISGTFVNEEKEIDKKSTFNVSKIKGKSNLKLVLGAKIGDVITFETKGLFTENHDLMNVLAVSHDDAHDLDVAVQFTLEEVTETELAVLNQEFYDKIFGEGAVKSEKEFKAKLAEDIEKQFEQQADQQLLNAVTESLIENTKFDLPADFLVKWIAVSGEKQLTSDEAKAEYDKSEKGLRYQLIEGKLINDNSLNVTLEELRDFAKGFIKMQMAQYGNPNPEEKQLDEIADRILTNQDETKRLSEQLMQKKLLDFFKANVKLKAKEVTFDDFVKEVYKK